ncbi:MAG: hypothetical protein KME60_08475 [Cyanomargarita calcarea GSE-NOS-MK-12-04C]|jgi:hypothetical protein|uniref:Uncharacterized protein n=1 Tax=Cyanomargarita calcarea GSE-NOS-MK-12-04C TaxID=2839659 RepID=A0A951USN7_9CYAN|nr:hypothetical protein [Cyanomargarita calcarea GSE-NOS-MK-12-04C]
MFQLVGIGEQAGSGIPKIYRNWKRQHWRSPELLDKVEPDQTLLGMLMVNLLPQETIKELDERFGSSFRELLHDQQLALAKILIYKPSINEFWSVCLSDRSTSNPCC